MKNLKKFLFSFLMVAGVMFFSINGVKAEKGKIEVVDDPNPDEVIGFSIPLPGEEDNETEESPSENEQSSSDEGEEAGNN